MTEHTEDNRSRESQKDACFEEVAALANKMIDQHGTDFAMGTLVLAAKFIAEGKPLASIKEANIKQEA